MMLTAKLGNRQGAKLLALCLLALFTSAFYAGFLPSEPVCTWDSILYVAGAEGLADGKGYRLVTHETDPPIRLYPPLQSAYLSLFWRMSPLDKAVPPSLRTGMLLLGVAATAAFAALMLVAGAPLWLASSLALAFATCPNWFGLLATGCADPLFTCLAFATLLFWLLFATPTGNWKWLVLGLLAGLLYLTKTAGIAFAGGIGMVLLARLIRGREARPLLLFLVPASLGITAWKLMVGPGFAYEQCVLARIEALGGWSGSACYLATQSLDYLGGDHFLDMIAPVLLRIPTGDGVALGVAQGAARIAALLLWLVLLILVVLGALKASTGAEKGALAVAFCYLVQVLAWPFPLGSRSLFCVLPLLCVLAWRGAGALAGRWKPPRVAAAVIGFLLILNVLINCRLCVRGAYWPAWSPPGRQQEIATDLRHVAAWTLEHVPTNSHIVATLDIPIVDLHLLSGRKVLTSSSTFPGQYETLDARVLAAKELFVIQRVGFNDPTDGLETLRRRMKVAYASPHGAYRVLSW